MENSSYPQLLYQAFVNRVSELLTNNLEFDRELEKLLKAGVKGFEISNIIVQTNPPRISTRNVDREECGPIFGFFVRFAEIVGSDEESMLLAAQVGNQGLDKFILPPMQIKCEFRDIVGRKRNRMISRKSLQSFRTTMERLGMPDPDLEQ